MTAVARARGALSAIFFLNGAVLASWAVHIPAVKAQHRLGDGGLGLVLLSMAVGSVVALPLAAWLIGRRGSRWMTAVAATAFCLALPLPLLCPSVWALVVALGLFGAFNAMLDVAMNAQAVDLEREYGRPILSAFHGLFSAGGVAGAMGATAAMSLGTGALWHVGGTSAGAVVTVAIASRQLRSALPRENATPVFARPPAALLGLGALTFCALLAEGAMADWSAVYLRDSLDTTAALAAGGFAAFSLTMAAGRFCGDGLTRRLGPAAALGGSAAIGASGLGLALLVGDPLAAILGFGLVGLGIANAVPILFGAAARVPGVLPGTALAAVATTGYTGLLAGPPLIGLAAEVAGLPAALGLVVLACAGIAAGSRALPDRAR